MSPSSWILQVLLVFLCTKVATGCCYYSCFCVYTLWYFWFGLFWMVIFIIILIVSCVKKQKYAARNRISGVGLAVITTSPTSPAGQQSPPTKPVQPPSYTTPSQPPPAYAPADQYPPAPYGGSHPSGGVDPAYPPPPDPAYPPPPAYTSPRSSDPAYPL